MITAEQYIETHRDTACRADWLASLSEAANLVLEGAPLVDKDKRRAIALDILAAINFLSLDLSATAVTLSDCAEREVMNEKKGAEKNRTDAPVLNHAAAFKMPGAWYDLSARVSEAQSVASCALESVPCGLQGVEYDRINHTGNLIAAVEDILRLMQQDVDLIEVQMKA